MKKFSCKKLLTALALSMSLALTVPSVLPVVAPIATVEAATAPTLSQTSLTLRAGEVTKLKVSNKGKKAITWTTNNKKVATVKKGVVTATGKGSAVITAKVGKTKLKCVVVVSDNSFSLNLNDYSGLFNQDIVYFVPSSVYYKDGKLFCKAALINQQFVGKIKKVVDKKGNDISKLDVVLTGTTFTNTGSYTDTVIAKGKVKNTLPKNIPYNNSKYFTVEFSGSQIREKGFDLSKIDLFSLDIKNKLYVIH
jgi:hypothetical protein